MQAQNKKKCKNFGERVKHLRDKRGFTQAKLASLMGHNTHVPVSRIEQGKSWPKEQVFLKIAEALDADLHWLITGQISPSAISVGNAYMPFVKAHMQDIIDKLHGLVGERMDLMAKQAAGEIHTLRLDELQEEIANLQGYYQAILKSLDESLEPLELQFRYSVNLVPNTKKDKK